MKKILFSIALLLVTVISFAQNAETKFTGNWYAEEMDKSTVQIYKAANGFYYGKIISSDKATNIGKLIITKLKFNESDNVFEGTMVKPSNGIEANAKLILLDDRNLKVVAKKYFMKKTIMMKRL
jgi:Uncharacterized protein conserved in bacteria (DUF2147)